MSDKRFPRNIFKPEKNKLWHVIIIPSLLIIISLAAFMYIEAEYFSRKFNSDTIAKLQENSCNQIENIIGNYLNDSVEINILNANLFERGLILTDDARRTALFFLDEVINRRFVDYVYFANEEGGGISSGITKGEKRISYTENMKRSPFLVNRVNNDNKLEYLKTVYDFNPEAKSWYKGADTPGEVFWTDIYSGVQDPVLCISNSVGVFDSSGKRTGVFGSDVLLDKMSSCLREIRISSSSRIYLFETDGSIIADTGLESPFSEKNGSLNRLNASDSVNSVLSSLFSSLAVSPDFDRKKTVVSSGNKKYYADINAYKVSDKVSWIYAVVIPEDDFLAGYYILIRRVKRIVSVMVFITAITYVLISLWILTPVKQLLLEIHDMARGKWGNITETGRKDIFGDLIHSFNSMSRALNRHFSDLEKKNEELNLTLEDFVRAPSEQLCLPGNTDELTGLCSRSYLTDTLEKEYSVFNRYGIKLSVVLFDFDNFSKINNTYGHPAGDDVLRKTAEVMKKNCRDTDTVGRYDGGGFFLIMAQTGIQNALVAAERYRSAVSGTVFGSREIRVTISGGAAELEKGESPDQLVSRAESLLLRAKENGRNRIEF